VQLGGGTRLEQTFSSGTHTLRLTATNTAGLSGTAEVSFEVKADSDADGIADDYEAAHGLVVGQADADSDTDGDGLTAREEFTLGLNPTSADSDGDSFTDGDEQRLGSNPADPTSVPSPELLTLSTNVIAFGLCPTTAKPLTITTPTPQTTWSASTTMPGLTVTPPTGTGSQILQLTLDCAQLGPGDYQEVVWLITPGGRAQGVLIAATAPGGEPAPPPVTIEPIPDLVLNCNGSGFAIGAFTPQVTVESSNTVIVESDPPSGSQFALGTNVVTVTARTTTTTNQVTFHVIVNPTVPELSIKLDSGEVLLSWSTACGQSVLESSMNLKSSWDEVPATPTHEGSTATVRLALSSGHHIFFRLRQP
jgi:hypothetical protein